MVKPINNWIIKIFFPKGLRLVGVLQQQRKVDVFAVPVFKMRNSLLTQRVENGRITGFEKVTSFKNRIDPIQSSLHARLGSDPIFVFLKNGVRPFAGTRQNLQAQLLPMFTENIAGSTKILFASFFHLHGKLVALLKELEQRCRWTETQVGINIEDFLTHADTVVEPGEEQLNVLLKEDNFLMRRYNLMLTDLSYCDDNFFYLKNHKWSTKVLVLYLNKKIDTAPGDVEDLLNVIVHYVKRGHVPLKLIEKIDVYSPALPITISREIEEFYRIDIESSLSLEETMVQFSEEVLIPYDASTSSDIVHCEEIGRKVKERKKKDSYAEASNI